MMTLVLLRRSETITSLLQLAILALGAAHVHAGVAATTAEYSQATTAGIGSMMHMLYARKAARKAAKKGAKLALGATVAIIVVAIIIVCILIALVIWYRRRKRAKEQAASRGEQAGYAGE